MPLVPAFWDRREIERPSGKCVAGLLYFHCGFQGKSRASLRSLASCFKNAELECAQSLGLSIYEATLTLNVSTKYYEPAFSCERANPDFHPGNIYVRLFGLAPSMPIVS
jgi:hypothetical protein